MIEDIPVALLHCESYDQEEIYSKIAALMESAGFGLRPGLKILVKPNLLTANSLACANARVTAAICAWLLQRGSKIIVGDSPAFGRVEKIAEKIQLAAELKGLGLKITSLNKYEKVKLPLQYSGKPVYFPISRQALECDLILSLPKVKAHSQMRMTLAVKNCFGLVPGLHKAIIHARYGEDRNFFAECVASILEILPPVGAVADGVEAMHITGPINGKPYKLELLGACRSALWLDMAILTALKIPADKIPVSKAAIKREGLQKNMVYPLQTPDEFCASGFIVPENLRSASFNPLQLLKSMCKRALKKFA